MRGAMIGHNSAAFGQTASELSEFLTSTKEQTRAKSPRFPYFKFYPRDWLEATRAMSLEERGAYIDLICILMEMEGHLRDDDRWIAHQMHVSPRKWKTLKTRLVDHEKIAIEDGLITNERCAKELASLLDQRRKITEAATTREQNKREKSVKHPGNIRETSVKQSSNVSENLKKTNKNNDGDTTAVPRSYHYLDSDIEEERKKEDIQPPPRQDPVVAVKDLDGLNGATAAFVERLAGWINPMMPDRLTARASLENLVKVYPPDIVRDGFAHVEAKILSGDPVPSPIKYLTGTCRGMHAEHLRDKQKASKPKTYRKPNPWD